MPIAKRPRTLGAALSVLCAFMPGPSDAQTAGFTPGSFSVTGSGAAEYRIPIRVPPGIAGMEPHLALVYNSQGGNGVLGIRWSLEGLSVISRCPQTIAQDNVRGAVKHDAADRFCLDGQRLMMNVGTTYGAAGTEYRTEREGFSRIIASTTTVSYPTGGVMPQSFTVKTKAGLIMQYGNSTDSRIEAPGTSIIRVWALNRVTDTKGNYMTFSYNEDSANGAFYLSSIQYTLHPTGPVPAGQTILFHYESRNDAIKHYHAGALSWYTQRLRRIQVLQGQHTVRDYWANYPTYSPASNLSRISSIRECVGNSGTDCLPPIDFTWLGVASSFSGGHPYSAVIDWGWPTGRQWVDFNGDGKADYCRVTGNANFSDAHVACTLSTGAGFGDTIVSNNIGDWGWPEGRAWADFNGDGLADYCRVTGNANFSDAHVACTPSTGTGFGTTITSGNIGDWGWPAGRAFVDFDGDGKADYCRAGDGYLLCTVSLVTPFDHIEGSGALDIGYEAGRAWADFNGDGKADYCRITGNQLGVDSRATCTLSNGNNFGQTIVSPVLDWGYAEGRAWVDFNGDGKADYCRVVGSPAYAMCTLSTGTGFGDTIVSNPIDWGQAVGRAWVDFNGDGKADYCRPAGSAAVATCILSTGNGFGDTVNSYQIDQGFEAGRGWPDFNGDGKADYCRIGGNTNGVDSHAMCINAGLELPDLISAISISGDLQTSIVYKSATDANVYTKGTGAVYPVVDVQAPIYVVESATMHGGGSSATQGYKYGGLRTDYKRGSLGFNWMETTNQTTLIKQRTELRQDWPYLGLPSLVRKTQNPAALLNEQTNTYQCMNPPSTATPCTVAPGNRYFPFASQTVETGKDLNGANFPTITTTTQYGPFGNATVVTVGTGDGFSKTTTNLYHDADEANWILGRLKSSTVQSTIP